MLINCFNLVHRRNLHASDKDFLFHWSIRGEKKVLLLVIVLIVLSLYKEKFFRLNSLASFTPSGAPASSQLHLWVLHGSLVPTAWDSKIKLNWTDSLHAWQLYIRVFYIPHTLQALEQSFIILIGFLAHSPSRAHLSQSPALGPQSLHVERASQEIIDRFALTIIEYKWLTITRK